MNATARRKRNQKGEGMIEGALIFFTLMCMIFFIVEMGRILFFQQYLAERARAGARWAAAQTTFDQTKIKAVVCFNDSSNSGSTGYFGLPTSNVAAAKQTVNGRTVITVSISGFSTPMYIPIIAHNLTLPPAVATAIQ